jgi:Fe-S cluster assembly ATP-binding protein
MFNGRIVKSSGKELAFELEKKGYEWLKPADEENEVGVNG